MKTITLQLGGKERTLNVGIFAFTYHLGEYLGSDPLAYNPVTIKGRSEYAIAVIYAGLMADCDSKKVKAEFTKEELRDWVMVLEMDEINRIIDEYGKLNKSEVPGE